MVQENGAIGVEWSHFELRIFSKLVPRTNREYGLKVVAVLEAYRFSFSHGSPLPGEGSFRRLGESGEVFGILETEVALGLNMSFDEMTDPGGASMFLEEVAT